MTKVSTTLANFVTSFIEQHCDDNALITWNEEFKDKFLKMANKQVKKSSGKKTKDENAPKGARSAYILFCMKERPKIAKEFPELSNQDKVKLMAERWSKAKEDDKIMDHFKKLADEDRERAAKEKENYVPTESEEEPTKKKSSKGGKRSKTGYQIFCADERGKVKEDGFTGKEITTELAKRWKALKEEDEDRYSEYMIQAAELKKNKDVDVEVEEKEEEVEVEEKEEEKPKKKTKKSGDKKKAKIVLESDDDDDDDIIQLKPIKQKKTKKSKAKKVEEEVEEEIVDEE